MSNEEKFSFESLQDPESIKGFLQSLIDGFDSGRIILTSEDNEIILYPDALMKFSVKSKKKPGSSKLALKFSWKESKKPVASKDSTINITN